MRENLEEYCNSIASNSVIAIAIDEIDRITTVSLSKNSNGYCLEVIYSPEFNVLNELHNLKSSFKEVETEFLNKIATLEKRNHEFDITWFF